MPLYIGACSDLMVIQMGAVRESAWCAVERVLAFVLLFSGKIPWVVKPVQEAHDTRMQRTSSGGAPSEEVDVLLDPRNGSLTKESDREYIEVLLALAQNCRSWQRDNRTLSVGQSIIQNWSMPRAARGPVSAPAQ